MPRTKSTEIKTEEKTSSKETAKTNTSTRSKTVKTKKRPFEDLNKVEGLDIFSLAKPYVNPVTGTPTEEVFLPVKDRVSWFRMIYPKGRIIPIIKEANSSFVLAEASIYLDGNPDTLPIATAINAIEFDDPIYGGAKAYQSAETCAIGRALAFAGFGTQVAGGELETPIIYAGAVPKKNNTPASDIDNLVEDDIPQQEKTTVKKMAEKKEEKRKVAPVASAVPKNVSSDNKEPMPFEVIKDDVVNPSEDAYDKKVIDELKNMDAIFAGGCLITFGRLRNHTVKEAFITEQKAGRDPIAALSEYVHPKDCKDDYINISAACKYYIEKYNEKSAEKKES